MKKCKNCGEVKPLTEFPKCKKTKKWTRGECKKCCNKRVGEWHKNNLKYGRQQQRKLRKIPSFRINKSISNGIWKSLKGNKNGRRWETLIGYTLEELIIHLESKFEDWMSWENYGKWHIDHIKPRSLFSFTSPEDPEFKECWALENLQPLEAIANIKKSNKIIS